MSLAGRDLVRIDDLSLEEINDLMALARRLEPVARGDAVTRVLEGAILASLFFEASTRTRLSFGAAFARLGGDVRETVGFTFSSMAKGESIADTARVVSGYADIMVVRHPEAGSVQLFADAALIPVINGGDGPAEHPTQALLDLYTMTEEFRALGKPLEGAHILFCGDLRYGRTVHSLAKLLSLFDGIRFSLLSPAELSLPEELISILEDRGHEVMVHTTPPVDAKVDLVYTTRIQRERLEEEMTIDLDPGLQVNHAFLAKVGTKDTIVMHPLPRDSRPGALDLSTDLDDDPRLAIFRQTDRGIPIRMALFAAILEVDEGIEASFTTPAWRSPKSRGVPSRLTPRRQSAGE